MLKEQKDEIKLQREKNDRTGKEAFLCYEQQTHRAFPRET